MQSNLPPVIVDMIRNMKDPSYSENIRHNYLMMLKNVANEINIEIAKAERILDGVWAKPKRKNPVR